MISYIDQQDDNDFKINSEIEKNEKLVQAVKIGDYNIAEYLLANNANPNVEMNSKNQY